MTPVEILALVFAVLVIVKLVFLAISPKTWMGLADSFITHPRLLTLVYLLLAVASGYYLVFVSGISVVTIAAVMMFSYFLMGVSFFAYPGPMLKLSKQIMKDRNLFKTNWLAVILYLAFTVWVLMELF